MRDTLGVIGTADFLSGSLKINSGFGGASTLQLGTTGFTDTLADLAKDFTTGAEKNLGIAATLNQAGTQLTFTQTSGGLLLWWARQSPIRILQTSLRVAVLAV
jgi:hypothetical protein